MKDISELTEKQYNFLANKSSLGHSYFFESNSLIYELKKLQLDHQAETSFWVTILGKSLSKEAVREDYIFYVKNCIYRIYDFVNKYSRMINGYYNIKGLTKWTDFKNINKTSYKRIPEPLKMNIRELFKNKELKEILISRHLMTHNNMVKTRKDYISHWVLPLNGENVKSFEEWKDVSESKLSNTVEKFSDLFLETLEVICAEEK